jgi:hypothetical protein
MSFVIIIPSKTSSNLFRCVDAINRNQPNSTICVIDDGLDTIPPNCHVIAGIKPFQFPRNINLGIAWSSPHSVVLLNDDALLESPNGFGILERACTDNPDYGLIGCTTNVTGQPLQFRRSIGLREVPHIAFVSVFIPRSTIVRIGPLDERYCLDYGVDDRDYCESVRHVGLKVGVHDDCYCDHGSIRSEYRGSPTAPRSYALNYELFKQKWGLTS